MMTCQGFKLVFWALFFASASQAVLMPNRYKNLPIEAESSPADALVASVLFEPAPWEYRRPELDYAATSYDDMVDSDSDAPEQYVYQPRKVGHFSWSTCGVSSDPFQITNLTVSPDPIKLGSPLTVTASGLISADIGAPIEVDVTVQKKVFVWVTLPCVDDIGSCKYADLCARLPPPPCPQPLVEAKLPCSCPFPAGTYSVKDLQVEFDTTKYPAWLTEGDFKAHIVLKRGDQSIGCYDVELNITS